jgi:hypothetical protein
MWSVKMGGTWQRATTDQVRDQIRHGLLGSQTIVQHDSWKEPGRLGQVEAFAALFPTDDDRKKTAERPSLHYATEAPPPPSSHPSLSAPPKAPEKSLAKAPEPMARPDLRPIPIALGGIGGLICLIGGVYMLSWTSHAMSVSVGPISGSADFFSVLRIGLGLYFCGKGLAIWAMAFGFASSQKR